MKILLIFILAITIGAGSGFLYWSISDLPEIRTLESFAPFESSFVYSSDGKVLAELFVERRNFISHYNMPDNVKNAFIAVEDKRFYSHPGIDIIGILRALYRNIRAKDIVEGGSTITQQLARMLFLQPERTISRKIKEAIITIKIERLYTKDEILGMYLNQTYFGTRAYGIEAAARTYFGISIDDLSIAEAALLAALPRAPSLYSPFRNPERALSRRNIVLRRMLDNGFISREEHERALAESLPVRPNHRRYEAPYFIELLRQQLEAKYGKKIHTSGLRIHSTINYNMQKAAEKAVLNGISAIEKRVRPGVQAALIAIDPRTGHIKAMVGGTDFWETQFNRATMALRQPGSAFKPFVFAAAIENGMSVGDEILDGPVFFAGARPNSVWSPRNYNDKYHGFVSLKTALALSLNTATVRLAHHTGIKDIISTAQRYGIRSELQPYLSTALGASTVTLLEITSAYAVFATGDRVEPMTYEKVFNRDGLLIEEKFPSTTGVLMHENIDKMKDILRAVVETGTGQRARQLNRTVYGKTGTTNSYTDAWFIGFDDRLVVGVWVGRDNHTPIGHRVTGASAALPIWMEFMKTIQ
jgi:penicillin-binding protein 1A